MQKNQEFYLGGRPSTDGNKQTWANSVSNDPAIVYQYLKPLWELVTQSEFPSLSNDAVQESMK